MTLKQAVCALLIKGEGQLLGVSRRNRPGDMNLPGGKVDPGETLEEACVREVFEETGFKISNLRAVFRRPCEGEDVYECTTFLVDFEGTLNPEEGLLVRWISWNDLLNPSNSFAHYNKRLFEAVKQHGFKD